MSVKLNTAYLEGFVSDAELSGLEKDLKTACAQLAAGTGAGNDFIGWRDLPTDYDKEEFARIKDCLFYTSRCV